MNRLNGWQRIFLVTALLYIPITYNSVSIIEPEEIGLIIKKQLPDPPNRYGDDTKAGLGALISGVDNKEYRLSDGATITLDKSYTQEEVESAYKKAMATKTLLKHEAFQVYLIRLAKSYFLPLIGLYLLGWSVGWIRRGFKKSSSGK